jgi:serine/threonine-protein kinase
MNRLVEAEVLVGSLDFEKLTEEEIYLLAKELESRDLGKEARKVFEKLYLIDPDFQDVRARLAELRHQLSGFSEDELVETIARRILDRRYVDAHLFNKGGGGFLFRVKDRLRSGEELALKILSPLQMNDPMVVRRFLREARTVGALDHPNLIRVYDVFEASLPYYTMEFVEACSVMELMQSVGPMDPARVGRLVAQACRGLQHAHEHGLIHRDVKPHNLLVGNGDQVKVIDFGVARVMGSAESLASGQISGTPLYMSPEQARGDATGPESDLYSLGLVLFEMLYGRLPYQTMQARLVDAVPRPATNSSIPDLLVEVMMTALRTEPEARFSSMKEMEQALIKAISHGSQESSGVPPIPSGR